MTKINRLVSLIKIHWGLVNGTNTYNETPVYATHTVLFQLFLFQMCSRNFNLTDVLEIPYLTKAERAVYPLTPNRRLPLRDFNKFLTYNFRSKG
jgi:hypothetical protein